MKALSFIGLLAVLLVAPIIATAQLSTKHSPKVEIMPSQPGILKVLYVNDQEKKVKVKIIGSKGLLFADRITLEDDSKGFVKRYDLNELETGIYWVEISNQNMTVKYQFDYLDDKKVFAHYWQWANPTTPGETIVASSK